MTCDFCLVTKEFGGTLSIRNTFAPIAPRAPIVLSAQNGGIKGKIRNPILNVWVSFTALFDAALIIFLEASRSQGNPVIYVRRGSL